MGEKEFIRLYNEHAKPLYAFLSYRTGDRVLAEDMLADTFERVLHARRGFDRRKAGERTWLYSIALNCVRDHARRTATEAKALARMGPQTDAIQADPGIAGLELKDVLHEALATLSDVEREAVALRFGADLALADIADLLNEPRSKVETRIYRGLKKLQTCLTPTFRPTFQADRKSTLDESLVSRDGIRAPSADHPKPLTPRPAFRLRS